MKQSPCDVMAYHAYNGSEIALSKMLSIASCITGCLCLRKKYKKYIQVPYHQKKFIFTKKTKTDFLPQKPPLKISCNFALHKRLMQRHGISRKNILEKFCHYFGLFSKIWLPEMLRYTVLQGVYKFCLRFVVKIGNTLHPKTPCLANFSSEKAVLHR